MVATAPAKTSGKARTAMIALPSTIATRIATIVRLVVFSSLAALSLATTSSTATAVPRACLEIKNMAATALAMSTGTARTALSVRQNTTNQLDATSAQMVMLL